MSFDVIPAIDLRGGRVVRLRQGDYARETIFDDEAVQLARRYADQGATCLHVVDLDGARSGSFANLAAIELIAQSCPLTVQAGGGVRGIADLEMLYDAGVARVVVGSIAMRDPEATAGWIEQFGPERLVIAMDARFRFDAWRLAVHGWTQDSSVLLDDLAEHYACAGARHVLCTDIDRDGMLGGLNFDLYRHLHDLAPDLGVVASGGARSLDDIRRVREAGAQGVVLGRALLEGRFTLAEALQC